MVSCRGVLLALLPLALTFVSLAAVAAPLNESTRDLGVAAFMGALALVGGVLIVTVLRHPEVYVPGWMRGFLALIAVVEGIRTADADAFLAVREGTPVLLAAAVLAGIGALLALAHVIFYRAPPKPEADDGAFAWSAKDA